MGFSGILDFLLFATQYKLDFSNVGFPPEAVIGLMACPFVLWALVTAVIYAIARACSGTGSLAVTFQNIGFGMFPLAVVAVIRFLVSILFHGSIVAMA